MLTIANLDESKISNLEQKIKNKAGRFTCLEQAAQYMTDIVYEGFKDSIVLARLFTTIPFGQLPDENQQFVTGLADSKGVGSLINDRMLVLSLLGSRGQEKQWNDRRNSAGHIGIPLVSADFIELIPMMSRLLKSLGLSLDWISETDTDIVAKRISRIAGVFHVPNARTAVDEKGRLIISKQDFVDDYDVRTVFGTGGGYVVCPAFFTMIIFTREQLEKTSAEMFMPLAHTFTTATTRMVWDNNIFK